MPVVSINVPLEPHRMKTVGSFKAPNPWNGGAETTFAIDLYRMVPVGARAGREGWWSGRDLYGIRSEVDDAERVMPEALTELWSTKRVPSEALPRLLSAIQPTLRPTDATPLLRVHVHRWLAAVFGALAIVLLVVANRVSTGGNAFRQSKVTLTEWLARPPVVNEQVIADAPVDIQGTLDIDFTPRVPTGVFAVPGDGHYTVAWFRATGGSRLLFAPRAQAASLPHLALVGVTVRPGDVGFPEPALADLRARVPGVDTSIITALYWAVTDSAESRGVAGWFLAAMALMSGAGAAVIYLMVAVRQARRRRQMAWLLSKV